MFVIAVNGRRIGIQVSLVLVTLAAALSSVAHAADTEQPALNENRLFLSNEDRLRYAEPVAPLPATAAVPELVQPWASPVRRSISIQLDGYVRQPDGRVDVWVNGELVDGKSGFNVSRVTDSGHVVLHVEEQRVTLRPGQREKVVLQTVDGGR